GDGAPAGMFQRFPIFQRLITWTKPDAPVARTTREYEWYDHNSLLADEPELKALVPGFMDRAFDLPSRSEMKAGIAGFANKAALRVRYGCTWESTRYDGDRVVLATTDGDYSSRAVVFAVGVTERGSPPFRGSSMGPITWTRWSRNGTPTALSSSSANATLASSSRRGSYRGRAASSWRHRA